MISIEVSLKLPQEFYELMLKLKELAAMNMADGMVTLGGGVRRILAAATPDRTGATKRQWVSADLYVNEAYGTVTVRNDSPVAWWLEYGTPPHTIRPTRGEWLAIPVWTLKEPPYSYEPTAAKVSGTFHPIVGYNKYDYPFLEMPNGAEAVQGAEEYIFVREVQHPGTQPYGMVRNNFNNIIRLMRLVGSGIMLSTVKGMPYYTSEFEAVAEATIGEMERAAEASIPAPKKPFIKR